ncbi:patatin-like protein [Sphingomonas sp. LaA6.9]|uniref:patatin-like protein n=1 Tax=Sphingomonas sp. LaA6.9 TaxID=2919914 RepID=UPI001F4FA10C|nr:patatin-like protein [Sphingomonas sp. LaA6.9]MCJ8157634.1 patatin-like protein [Sphingomonas sp. LaA6.9]
MREKELRLALVCYGGISLAVYMHGITKEIWRLVRASRHFHDGDTPASGSQGVYHQMLQTIEVETGTRMRVLADIIAGASAGGINGIFLAQAIATGQSLDPLTDLWLDCADVDRLLDPDARPLSRFSKFWAQPLVWVAAGKSTTVERTVEPSTREEVRAKLSSFIRARWFEPPFGGEGFTNLLLDAFEAMGRSETGPALLPDGQPLDLFVTVTDFHGHPERLRLNSPAEVVETEHRLVIGFSTRAQGVPGIGDVAELAFAARATASFPGAFPPFTVGELDAVLDARKHAWPGRDAFLARALPRQSAAGVVESTALIDGSVLANAPFAPAIGALRNRPARREVDRRFVYIDPKPGIRSIQIGRSANGEASLPGFFGTIFGALSDLPRTQPIRDNLEAIENRSSRIRRMRTIVEALRPEVEESIESLFGITLFLDRPTAARLATWRARAQDKAARSAGHAYPAYGHLKLSGVIEEVAAMLFALSARSDSHAREEARRAIWNAARAGGLDRVTGRRNGATEPVIDFFRAHDLGFRIRRLRFLARRLSELSEAVDAPLAALDAMSKVTYECLALYLDREILDFYGLAVREAATATSEDPQAAIDALAAARNLRVIDQMTDERIAEALAELPKAERRVMLLTYLGFPYYDIATLPLLQGEGLDEFDPVKVDRISPDDATTIRSGGAEATLKGIQFNSFGAFFSRAYRENDYLWGRLHGADRLIDILISSLPVGKTLGAGAVSAIKQAAFAAILDEEEPRLTAIPELFRDLRREIGVDPLANAAQTA